MTKKHIFITNIFLFAEFTNKIQYVNIDKSKKYSIINSVEKELKGEKIMLAKMWKKIGIFILIVACIFNIMLKLVKRISLNTQLKDSITYMQDEYKEMENKTK